MGCVLTGYVLNLVLVLSFLILSSFHPKKKKKQIGVHSKKKKKKKRGAGKCNFVQVLTFSFLEFWPQ